MRTNFCPTELPRSLLGRTLVCSFLAVLAAAGCAGKDESPVQSVTEPPTVEVIQPPQRTIKRIVGQPSFVESYERTSIYPKVTGYIEKWN
jgi:hypothetical protein